MTRKKKGSYDLNQILRSLAAEETLALIAFRQLYDCFSLRIYQSSKKILRSETMAKDIVQEVFISIWQRRKELSHIISIESYLFGVARNRAMAMITSNLKNDSARKEYVERMLADDGSLYKEQCEHTLNRLVDALPTKRQEIFRLAKYHGMKHEAIASQLNISVNTVQHAISKALKFIHERKDAIGVLLMIVFA